MKIKDLYKLTPTPLINNELLPNTTPLIIGLTGASGFLGLHIINELLNQHNDKIKHIKCFVRSVDKFHQKKQELNLIFPEDKISFYTNLNDIHFEDINHFIHCAAHLNSLMSYQQLWDDNVELTLSVLKKIRCKIQYISTLSVFASSNIFGTHPCSNIQENTDSQIIGGYAQTKFISEQLIQNHPDFQIIRLGLLTPSTLYPKFQQHEFMYQFLQFMKKHNVYPENFHNAWVDISPVDLVATEICKLIFNKSDSYIHIANKKSTSLKSILQTLQSKPIPKKEWLELISHEKNTLKILLLFTFFKDESIIKYPKYYNIDLFQSTNHYWQGSLFCDKIIEKYIES